MPTRTQDLTFRFRSLCMNCWTSTTPTSHGMVHAGTVASRFDTGTWAVPISWMKKTKTRQSKRKWDKQHEEMLSRHYSGNETSLFRLRLSTTVISFTTTHDTTHHTAHHTPNNIIRRNTAQRCTQGTEVWKSIRQMPRFVHHDIHSTRLRAYKAWMGPCMRSDSSSILVITSTFHRRTRHLISQW